MSALLAVLMCIIVSVIAVVLYTTVLFIGFLWIEILFNVWDNWESRRLDDCPTEVMDCTIFSGYVQKEYAKSISR